jgi:plastocyanin
VRRTAAYLLPLLLLVPTSAHAETAEVAVGTNTNTFTPDRVRIAVGDSVHWSRLLVGNPHNVREDGSIFRSGDTTPGPIDFSRVFSAGRFHYFCEIHGSQGGGMDGKVLVPVTIRGAPRGPAFTVRWAKESSQTGSAYDVQFRRPGGTWRTWREDTETLRGVFGKRDRPIAVERDRRYSFRARSQRGQSESGWSPPVTVNT